MQAGKWSLSGFSHEEIGISWDIDGNIMAPTMAGKASKKMSKKQWDNENQS